MSTEPANPCLACGACCATYRVSFYWAEAEGLRLDPRWTEQLTPFLACMAGTSAAEPRCRALAGTVGRAVHCRVHPQRPNPCREVEAASDQCQRARLRHGLPPLPEAPFAQP